MTPACARLVEAPESTLAAVGESLSRLLPSMSAIDDVSKGWADALLFDRPYIDSKLKTSPVLGRASQPLAACHSLATLGTRSAAQLLEELPVNAPVVDLADHMSRLDQLPEAALQRDDYWQASDAQLEGTLQSSFSAERLNVLVVGAGPVGALLASGLKRQLGSAVDVLLLESRVYAQHHKQPYSRRWQTNIPMMLLQPLLHPVAAQACAATGDGVYMGVDICTLESLALLSAREAGVRCLFSAEDQRSWFSGAGLHLIVDASGARWREPAVSAEKTYPGLALKNLKNRERGYAPFGLLRSYPIAGNKLDVLHRDGYLYPLHKGKVIKQSLLKMSQVPFDLYQPLLQWARKNNRDNKFYIWPGKKHADINHLLILVNLSLKEHRAIAKYLQQESSMLELLRWSAFSAHLTPEFQALIKLIGTHKEAKKMVTVSVPFLFEPKMLDPETHVPSVESVPVLSIGDSFYCGNPKTGNGLGVHLQHIRLIIKNVGAALTAR